MRITQFIDYLNRTEEPGSEEIKTQYTHLAITTDLKKVRQEYRKQMRKPHATQTALDL
jgi:hypothetical protein